MIFRELRAPEYKRVLPLRFVADSRIRLTDLGGNSEQTVTVPPDGKVWFEIASAPGFRFFRYEPA